MPDAPTPRERPTAEASAVPSAAPAAVPSRWRKRPVVVEAVQWDGTFSSGAAIVAWVTAQGREAQCTAAFGDVTLEILTLEGRMRAKPTDFIVRGVRGEFYPCDAGILLETYDPDTAPTEETQ